MPQNVYSSMSDYEAQKYLDDRLVTPTVYGAFSTTYPVAAATGFTELTAVSRVAVPLTRADRTVSNAAEVDFGTVPAGDNGAVVVAWGLFDAASSGNLLHYGAVADAVANVHAFIGSAENDFLYAEGHTFSVDDIVVLMGENLPTGLVQNQEYYVIGVSGDSFQLSLTASPGSAINLTADGVGIIAVVGKKTLNTGDPLKIPASGISITV